MARPPAPETISRYRVEAEVGRGGMGIVYRAFDPALHRRVAVKLIAPHLAEDPTLLARFQREAASAAQLRHPNIATVYEYGEHDGLPFIAFEWVEGRTLKQLLADAAPLPLERALRLLDQVGGALDHAHARGVVHRDVKPGNILVGDDDHAVVVDFGLAWLGSASTLTATGAFFGTPRYMSPEQIQGERVDGRSDLYSLTVVLFEMLAGVPPFEAESTPALIHKQLNVRPPPLREFNASLPAHVEGAVQRGLAKDPAARFPSAAALLQAVRALPTRDRPRTRRRGPAVLAALGAGVVLLICALAVIPSLAPAAQPTEVEPPSEPPPATEISPAATIEEVPSDTPLYLPPLPDPGGWWPIAAGDATQMGAVYAGIESFDPTPRWVQPREASQVSTSFVAAGGMLLQAASLAEGGALLRARNWETGELFWELPLPGGSAAAPVLHATETYFYSYVATDTWELLAFDSSGTTAWSLGAEVLLGYGAGGPVISSDGVLYLATDTGWLHAIHPESGALYGSADLTAIDGFYLAPAVGDSSLLLAGAQRTLTSVDRATLAPQWTAALSGDPSVPPVLLESNGVVFTGTYDGIVQAWSLATGELLWEFAAPSGIAGLSTDGGYVYLSCGAGEVYGLDPTSGTVIWETNAESQISAQPLSDGSTVLLATLAGQLRFLDAGSGAEVAERRIDLADPIGSAPAPAGGWLFVAAGAYDYAFGPP